MHVNYLCFFTILYGLWKSVDEKIIRRRMYPMRLMNVVKDVGWIDLIWLKNGWPWFDDDGKVLSEELSQSIPVDQV